MAETSTRYGIVGSGWRARFFLRLAQLMPDRFQVGAVMTRRAEKGVQIEQRFGVCTVRTIEELVAVGRPDFVITAVPWEINPGVVEALVGLGIPVLSETPPAPDVEGLRSLWSRVGNSGLVQVAEQYLLLPDHAARRAILARGVIGPPTSVQVSSTHLYHAVSMIRGLLGVRFEPATVRATNFTAPLADPLSPAGWSGDDTPIDRVTTIATIEFAGVGQMGLYDFTENQWWNPLRTRRIVIRGSLGEINGNHVVGLADPRTVIEAVLMRRETGRDLNLEGADLQHISFDGIVVYRNQFFGARLSDEEIAIATTLHRMGAWIRTEHEPPYPLAEACQDHLVALAISESVHSGQPVTTTREAWTPIGG
jgi:predicted dehydrogenase